MSLKHEAEQLDAIRGVGAEIEEVERKRRHLHVYIKTPRGTRKVVCPKNQGCPRGVKNLRSLVRRMLEGTAC